MVLRTVSRVYVHPSEVGPSFVFRRPLTRLDAYQDSIPYPLRAFKQKTALAAYTYSIHYAKHADIRVLTNQNMLANLDLISL